MEVSKLKKGKSYKVYQFETAFKKCIQECPKVTEKIGLPGVSYHDRIINMMPKVLWNELFKTPIIFITMCKSGNALCAIPYEDIMLHVYIPHCTIWKEVTEE